MNPETSYTNRVRTLLKRWYPDVVIVKHSDRFKSGIPDLQASRSNALVIWIEFKFIPSIAKKRKVPEHEGSELQIAFLKDHLEIGIPAYVLVGTDKNKSHMLYSVDRYDGYAYRKDVLTDDELHGELKWIR
tara:strand:+ start:34600 stop:34992 length:393 start_codon:yes stop_codon:yes gene_type:complete